MDSTKTTLYAYYDRVAMLFAAPYPAVNDGVAIRFFKSFCQDPQVHGVDLDLYRLGVLDQNTGEITVDGKPEFIFRMSEVSNDG